MMTKRLTIFKNAEDEKDTEITQQVDNISEDYLEGYATAYLDFCDNNYDYVIADVDDKSPNKKIYSITIEKVEHLKAISEEDAYNKYFESLAKNNETAETHLTDLMKIKRVQ